MDGHAAVRIRSGRLEAVRDSWYHPPMNAPLSAIPWNSPALWQAANASVLTLLRQNRTALGTARRSAGRLRYVLEQVFPIMENLCRQTCTACTDVCCRRAWVWIDFKDLLFLHLAGIPIPEAQLLRRQGDHCRYAGPHGCRLERIQRPFVCTWYVCPAQSHLLAKHPEGKQRLSSLLSQIKAQRRRMEDAFIRAVA